MVLKKYTVGGVHYEEVLNANARVDIKPLDESGVESPGPVSPAVLIKLPEMRTIA